MLPSSPSCVCASPFSLLFPIRLTHSSLTTSREGCQKHNMEWAKQRTSREERDGLEDEEKERKDLMVEWISRKWEPRQQRTIRFHYSVLRNLTRSFSTHWNYHNENSFQYPRWCGLLLGSSDGKWKECWFPRSIPHCISAHILLESRIRNCLCQVSYGSILCVRRGIFQRSASSRVDFEAIWDMLQIGHKRKKIHWPLIWFE